MSTSSILLPFRIFYGHFLVIFGIFSRFGMLCLEKSGNPGQKAGFASNEFPNCTSVTIESGAFIMHKNIFAFFQTVQLLGMYSF
jgi:hypothetical protein